MPELVLAADLGFRLTSGGGEGVELYWGGCLAATFMATAPPTGGRSGDVKVGEGRGVLPARGNSRGRGI
jgi:hypothetical protein